MEEDKVGEPIQFELARTSVLKAEVVPVRLVLACMDCREQMQPVGMNAEEKTIFYRCPKCQKGHVDTTQYPRIEFVEKQLVQPVHNFVNPNKGPRGRN